MYGEPDGSNIPYAIIVLIIVVLSLAFDGYIINKVKNFFKFRKIR